MVCNTGNIMKYIFSTKKVNGTQCGKMKHLVSPKNITSNQLFSNFITLLSRNFCQKCVGLDYEKRSNFHTVYLLDDMLPINIGKFYRNTI